LSLEDHFDIAFTTGLALREKQIQQNYRPIIGIHKWFARRPGTVFRNLLLAEFNGSELVETSYWRAHQLSGVIADPFMGGGTPIYEANRLGFSVVGTDINPMAFWVVRQSLAPLDLARFTEAADKVSQQVEERLGDLYRTKCVRCGRQADVKYFLWVKVATCPDCGAPNDLFPGYLLAENVRHPKNVLVCGDCGELNEYDVVPTLKAPARCWSCAGQVHVEGPAHNSRISCSQCRSVIRYPGAGETAPRHRMWAIEYHCGSCKPSMSGRFFKRPDRQDLTAVEHAKATLEATASQLPIPDDAIPDGDETGRLHRWGYERFRDMFNERQLLGLGLLLRQIEREPDDDVRHALLTVFSDSLRYQNMLCRYDTYALKCQDIFSVHGFPVGLIQCENNVLGVRGIGSGSFRHFIEKYLRAKQYCLTPFETRHTGKGKQTVFVEGERIAAVMVDRLPEPSGREARIEAMSALNLELPNEFLDGVFTDPPYFDNVQYAELMDFCYVWLRQALVSEFAEFSAVDTRSSQELTGNATAGRGLADFTSGLSEIFCHYARALKRGAPFVFTFHHNDPDAYVPLVVAILDAGLNCTATLPAPAEMGASLHIARTTSSIVDSVFVCRREERPRPISVVPGSVADDVNGRMDRDVAGLTAGGLRPTAGDIRCLRAGHIARVSINGLRATWDRTQPLVTRMATAAQAIASTKQEAMLRALGDSPDSLPKPQEDPVVAAI
jgi:adenine-specific DNA methylase